MSCWSCAVCLKIFRRSSCKKASAGTDGAHLALQDNASSAFLELTLPRRATRQARDGHLDSLSARGRPQARRLRRPASRLRGLTSATSREAGLHAVDGSFCPVPPSPDENEALRQSAQGLQLPGPST
jgi:hypothetical protein